MAQTSAFACCRGSQRRTGWIGKERDHETSPLFPAHKLMDLSARRYDPMTALFTSVDELWAAFPQQHGYHYAYHDPVNFRDPSGLDPQSGSGGIPGRQSDQSTTGVLVQSKERDKGYLVYNSEPVVVTGIRLQHSWSLDDIFASAQHHRTMYAMQENLLLQEHLSRLATLNAQTQVAQMSRPIRAHDLSPKEVSAIRDYVTSYTTKSSASMRTEEAPSWLRDGYAHLSLGGVYGLGAGIGLSSNVCWPLPGNANAPQTTVSLSGVGGLVLPEVALSIGYTYAPASTDESGEALGISTQMFTFTSSLNSESRLPDPSAGYTMTIDIGKQINPLRFNWTIAQLVMFGPLSVLIPTSYHVEKSWRVR